MTEKANMKVFEHPDDIYTVVQQTPRSWLFPGFPGIIAAGIVAAFSLGAYVANYVLPDPKTEVIQNIHAYLDKNQNHRLDNTEAQPLEKQGVSLPGFTTVDELTTILKGRPIEDLQSILENLMK